VVVGYVVMPEHIHLLLSEPERGNPSVVIQALKQGFARSLLWGLAHPSQPFRKLPQLWLPHPSRFSMGGRHEPPQLPGPQPSQSTTHPVHSSLSFPAA
jgi:hypothetical protein